MGPSVEQVRDFVLQVEKSLAARRLYNSNSVPYREANERVVERCRTALGEEGFTLRFGATDLFLDKQSLINRPKHDDSFFFPLYRDGLRELTFTTETSPQDLTALLGVFETKDQQLGPADDMVNHLWRCDLTTITHNAIDGIGDVEEDGADGQDDFRGLVADLAEKIKRPAAAESGQKYSFMLDADVQVAAQDFHYDATTVRRTFDENPAVLQITGEQANELRAEFNANRDQALLERFIEILLITVRLPFRSIDPVAIGPVLAQLAEGYWNSRELDRMVILLTHIRAAAQDAPNPDARSAMSDVLKRVITDERLVAIMSEFVAGRISVALASRLWEIVPDAQIWPLLLDTWSKLVEGEQRTAVAAALRKHLASNVELLAATLASPETGRVRAALALLDERTEKLFVKQVISLATHPEESIRLKGLAAAAKFGGSGAVDTLWKAMESDPSKSVRLFAFRAISSSKPAGLAPRLQTLVTSAQFAERPVWEREKYIRLLGTVGGPAVESLFESWIPSKRWMWQAKDLETLELALRGLGATGASGYEKVQKIAESGGKPGEVARKVLDSISRCEIGENTVMRGGPEKS